MKQTKKQKQAHQQRDQIVIKGQELISKISTSIFAERELKPQIMLSEEIKSWFAHQGLQFATGKASFTVHGPKPKLCNLPDERTCKSEHSPEFKDTSKTNVQ